MKPLCCIQRSQASEEPSQSLFTLKSLSKYTGSSATRALDRIRCFLMEFAMRLAVLGGWGTEGSEDTCSPCSSESFCSALFHSVPVSWVLLVSMSSHSSLYLLLSQPSVSVGHLRSPFQEMMKY